MLRFLYEPHDLSPEGARLTVYCIFVPLTGLHFGDALFCSAVLVSQAPPGGSD